MRGHECGRAERFRRCRSILVVVAATLLGLPGIAAADSGKAEVVNAYLARWQAETGAPGVSAAIAVDDRLVFSGGVGIADLQSGAPQNGRSVHNIGSISKTQALIAVMQLVEQGKVRLDAEIQTYAPWFPKKNQPITLRQILTHTSGIRHYKDGEFGPADVLSFRHYDNFEESTRFWRDDPLLFAPGSHWLYSSYATSLMQAVVEAASAESFESYLTKHVWRPAGMADTRLDVPARIVPRRGQGYVRGEKGVLENAPAEDVSYKYAGGGMISTDEDLCRFGMALNSGRLLKPDTLAQVYRLQLSPTIPYTQAELDGYAAANPGKTPRARGLRQGLIFMLDQDAQGQHYSGHSGTVKGTSSRFTNYSQQRVVVALHFNIADVSVDLPKAAEALAAIYLPLRAIGQD